MCNQTVSLVAAEIERRGVSTVCIALLREVIARIRPPRALAVPFRHGFPLGAPNDAALQKDVVLAALRLVERKGPVPLLADYR
jgi:hypothetical protein